VTGPPLRLPASFRRRSPIGLEGTLPEPLAADVTAVDTGEPTLQPGLRNVGALVRSEADPRSDERFLAALRFEMGQEAPSGWSLGRGLSEGAGLSDVAYEEYGRRNPERSLNDPNTNMNAWYDIWRRSGAAHLPDPLSLVHFDAAVNHGPGTARKMLAESGGDPARYLELREAHYRQIPNIGVTGDPSGQGEGDLSQNPGWLKKRMPALRAIGRLAREAP